MGMVWAVLNNFTLDSVGLIPMYLSDFDDLPATAQFVNNYIGGWDSFKGFELCNTDRGIAEWRLVFPGDPPLIPVAATQLRSEVIVLFRHSWVCVVQDDGSYEVARLD